MKTLLENNPDLRRSKRECQEMEAKDIIGDLYVVLKGGDGSVYRGNMVAGKKRRKRKV